ncbi:helicase RepA family protein [Sphingomonas psychrotolerans]|nr:helicase RepA family protein [Sphingomonas psychrotolerans]
MSLLVDSMADLHNYTDGAAIDIHHSGKDKENGMRGSTVLLGGRP